MKSGAHMKFNQGQDFFVWSFIDTVSATHGGLTHAVSVCHGSYRIRCSRKELHIAKDLEHPPKMVNCIDCLGAVE